MAEYAELFSRHSAELGIGEAKTFDFGPVRHGRITVEASGSRGPTDERPNVREDTLGAHPPIAPRVEIELIAPDGQTVARAAATSLQHDAPEPSRPTLGIGPSWKLRLRNVDRVVVHVAATVRYPSWNEVGTQVVPMAVFQGKFDALLHQSPPPFSIKIDHRDGKNVLGVSFASYVTDHFHIDDATVELDKIEIPTLGNDVRIKDLRTKKVRLFAQTERDTAARGGWRPRFRAELDFEDIGIELDVNNSPDVDLRDIKLVVDLDIVRRGPFVSYVPHAEFEVHTSVPSVGGVSSDYVTGKVKEKVTAAVLKQANATAARHAVERVLTRLITGGERPVVDVYGAEGSLHVEYAKPLGESNVDRVSPDEAVTPGPDTSANLQRIKHIVFLMMENRSFDHMLGYLSLHAGRDVDGLRGGESNRYNEETYRVFRLPETAFDESPCHEHECVLRQVNHGYMDGFVDDFARRFEDDGVSPGKVMGYLDEKHLPVYDLLAREFAICDHWYTSLPTATWPNRFFTLTGHMAKDELGHAIWGTPDTDHFGGWDVPTLFDHLSARDIDWRVYEHDVGFVRLFNQHKFDTEHIVGFSDLERGFFADAAKGRLPPVSFIEPNYVDVPGTFANDDHAPANIKMGQRLIASIYNALVASPQWREVLFVITYDEHGGFYDHVSPPRDWGPRVPAFVVSPWVPRGAVGRDALDHMAIIQTIIRRFMPDARPPMGARTFASRDLGFLLTNAEARTDVPRDLSPSWPWEPEESDPRPPPHDPDDRRGRRVARVAVTPAAHPAGEHPPRAPAASERVVARRGNVVTRDFRAIMTAFRARLIAERNRR